MRILDAIYSNQETVTEDPNEPQVAYSIYVMINDNFLTQNEIAA